MCIITDRGKLSYSFRKCYTYITRSLHTYILVGDCFLNFEFLCFVFAGKRVNDSQNCIVATRLYLLFMCPQQDAFMNHARG